MLIDAPDTVVTARHDPVVQDFIVRSLDDTEYFMRTLEPERYNVPFEPLHKDIFKVVDGPGRHKCIISTRGIAKTSICAEYTKKKALLREKKFILYVSKSATMAEMQTENIKRDLLANRLVRKLFGNIKESVSEDVLGLEGMEESFSKKCWTLFGEVLIMPRGIGQQVRGLLWNGNRPDLIVIDDLEDKENIGNEEVRKKWKNWFMTDLYWVGSRVKKDTEYLYIDTLKHADCIPAYLKDNPMWNTVYIPVCDDDLKSRAPSFLSDEELEAEKQNALVMGELDGFYMEVLCKSGSPDNKGFRREYFQYYDQSAMAPKLASLEKVILVDPAKTTNLKSDYSAVVLAAFDRTSKVIYFMDIVAGLYHPDEMYEIIRVMAIQHSVHAIAIEVNSLNEYITNPFRQYMADKHFIQYQLFELKPRGTKKEERIKWLVPLYRQGKIFHNKACCSGLESQLIDHPNARRDDISDAAAYILQYMEGQGCIFYDETKQEQKEREIREYQGDYDAPYDDKEPLDIPGYIDYAPSTYTPV